MEDDELRELISLIKELKQNAMNDDKAQASGSITCLLLAYDTLLARVTEDKAA